MKNKAKWLWLSLILIAVLVVPALASANTIQIDAKSFNGRTYLPLRKTFETMEYKVNWNGDTRVILIEKGDTNLHFKPNQPYFLINGVLLNSGEKPIIKNGTTYITLDTARQIFSSVEQRTKLSYSISRQLVAVDRGPQTLNGSAELNALLLFYPDEVRPPIMEDFNMTESAVEEAKPADKPKISISVKLADDENDFSETNNQVAGVSESDIVKTDGNYIYSLKDDVLQIIKAGRGELKVIEKLKGQNSYSQEMFLYQDKLVLISNGYSSDFRTWGDQETLKVGRVFPHQTTFIDIYDLSKLEMIGAQRLKRISVDGSYLTGRRIGQYLYLVANQGDYNLYPVYGLSEKDIVDNDLAPDELTNVDKMMYFPGHVSREMIYTVGVDLNNLDNSAIDINACMGGAQNVYADRESLYIANTRYNWWRNYDSEEKTDIYKFSIKNGKFDYQDSCSLSGHILNQFSMDVHNGFFRIAMTTRGKLDWNKTLNHLLILDDKLEVVGKVADLAPGERIYSTRMMGDKVFIVTYREVDPFFVIDASVPTAPKVLGYLKIPGYSNYMHPYDKNTIIGIGINTVEKEKGRIVNDGVKISLFDISDPKNPIEKDKVLIGNGNAYSEVDYDHKAFLFDAEKNIMALPISLQRPNGYSKDAYIFNFNKSGKLGLKGIISHNEISLTDKHYSDWHKDINRILYINNDLYTLSNDYLYLNDIDTLTRVDYLRR